MARDHLGCGKAQNRRPHSERTRLSRVLSVVKYPRLLRRYTLDREFLNGFHSFEPREFVMDSQ